jgi:ABC-type lipoprotein release transport system permease subunit
MLYAAIRGENLLAIAGAALGATLLAGLYPAWRAGRVEPVDAIRLV